MKQSQKQVLKSIAIGLCLISIGAYGQKQSKTYSENFSVATDAVLDIDTSHADIEFETWNKREVSVEATIELEGASKQEAEAYFENGGIEIMGNSNKVSITTGNTNSWDFSSLESLGNLHIELPELPEFESFAMDFDMAELADLPPMPPAPDPNFDYEAFQKDGEKYLKEWQKNFQKDFGEPYQKKMEEWQQKMEAKQEELQAKRQKMFEKRREAQAERMESYNEKVKGRAEAMAERAEKRREIHQKRMEQHQVRMFGDSARAFIMRTDGRPNGPNIFYFNSGDENRNYKVKKSIKIKMPKSTKIEMNVRHGEVKLAGNTKNMNATLSHASLFAAVIDGDKTQVTASYSPVSVQNWNYGNLQVDYSENVDLQEVLNLTLSATSSEVNIDRLSRSAFIQNDFGPLFINSVSEGFETLDVSLQNAELVCQLPKTAFTIYINGTDSDVKIPNNLTVERTANRGNIIYKGRRTDKNSDRSMVVNSKYSEVVLE